MKIRMLRSATDGSQSQYLTSFVVNDTLLVDAGAIGFSGHPSEQARIDHIFLSHSHADHVCSLPMFVANTFDQRSDAVLIHAHADVLRSLADDMFNGRVWPNFLRITRDGLPVLRLVPIAPDEVTRVDGVSVRAVPVNHPVPTFAYLLDDGASAVVICTDSGPTSAIWQLAAETPTLKAVFLGTSYTNAEIELARIAGHLTPTMVNDELRKLPGRPSVMAVHIKPTHHARVVEELQALGVPNLSIGEAGRDYVF